MLALNKSAGTTEMNFSGVKESCGLREESDEIVDPCRFPSIATSNCRSRVTLYEIRELIRELDGQEVLKASSASAAIRTCYGSRCAAQPAAVGAATTWLDALR